MASLLRRHVARYVCDLGARGLIQFVRDHTDCMTILLNAGADIHAKNDIILYEATQLKASKAITFALQAGANPLSEPHPNLSNIELATHSKEILPLLLTASPKTSPDKAKRNAATVAQAEPGSAALWLAQQLMGPTRALAQSR